jgi:hypothetical protein
MLKLRRARALQTHALSARDEATSTGGALRLGDASHEGSVDLIEEEGWQLTLPLGGAVAVLALDGQLSSLAWAFSQALPGARLGYVQSAAGARTGAYPAEVDALRERGLLAGQLAIGAAFGDQGAALTTGSALHHGLGALGWDAAVCGPGIVGGEEIARGGLAALEVAHTALALGCPTLLVPKMSSGDRRARRRGISHETLLALEILLQPVTVALPAGLRSPVGADLRAGLGAVFGASRNAPAQLELDVARPARIARHDWRRAPVDLPGFAAAALPADTTGRGLVQDPLYFGAALAAGATLAELVAESRGQRPAGYAEDGEDAAA